MTRKLFAIVSLAMALHGCAVEDDASDNATVDSLAAPSENEEVEVRGTTQALMPSIGVPFELVNLAYARREADMLMEHSASGSRVTAKVSNLSQTSNDVISVELKISATCRNASGTQQGTYTVTWNSGWIFWPGEPPSSYSAHSSCPTNWTLTSKKTVFKVLDKYVSF
jgi:hypothetical protein